jgi:LmbE family N-acetylglucosaminyl deacetylase
MTHPDMPTSSLPEASSVLAVCAHPDDESFGLGAILHRYCAEHIVVSVLCFTHGEASTLGSTHTAVREVRESELKAAATELGVTRVKLLDFPDGRLEEVPLDRMAHEVEAMAHDVDADLLLVFDEGGVTGHADHCRATQAALRGAPDVAAIAWSIPREVAGALNAEFDTQFAGRGPNEIDVVLTVDRPAQLRAIDCHASQSAGNKVLWRRLELLGASESLRWLRIPPRSERRQFERVM